MDINLKIRNRRRDLGLSQTELALKCGWDKDAKARISNYERGVRQPSIEDVKVICEALGINVGDMISGADSANSSAQSYEKLENDLKSAQEELKALRDESLSTKIQLRVLQAAIAPILESNQK